MPDTDGSNEHVQIANGASEKSLIPSRRSSNGVRLFSDGAAEIVRRVYAERMANRGRKLA